TTIEEFLKLDEEIQLDIIDFIKDLSVYEHVRVGDKKFLLVHAGLGNYSPHKKMDEYSLYELIWERANYHEKYFDDVFVITGHTPTQIIYSNPKPGYIFRKNNHIAIDCGACYPGGRLAALCLDTGEEFYTATNDEDDEEYEE
nr:serine/threonine protein phosphatase [Lachnospiraceae bacterium]